MDISTLSDFFSNAVTPVALVNNDLKILFANSAAKLLYPSLTVPDGLLLMIPSQLREEYKQKIQNGEPLAASDSSLLISGSMISFTPCEGGALVNFMNNYSIENSQKFEGLSRPVSALSGQIRTPLSNIFGMLGVVSQRLHSKGEYSLDRYLDEISQSSYLILREIVNLSELIKYNSHLSDSSPKVIDLWSFLSGAFESAAALTKSVEIPLEYNLPTSFFPFKCDTDRLLYALYNIISNSCRFTKENNKIIIKGSVKDSNAIITISDSGLGIPANYLSRVFEPFFSYDAGGSPFAGTGIGLTVARYIISSFGGSVNISSTELEGTSVAFTLPMSDSTSEIVVSEYAVDYLRNRFSPLYIGMCQSCGGPSL